MTTRYALLLAFIGAMVLATPSVEAEVRSAKSIPAWPEIEKFVKRYFDGQPDYKPGDLISRGHVDRIVSHLKKMGWRVSDRMILRDTLEDGSTLVQTLNTPAGVKFMRKVNKHPLIYSKMDRLSRQYGGRALMRDIVRLPNGHKYASPNRARGVPSMVDLLPKKGSSRAQSIKDYSKPTGRIYTVKELLKRLKATHDKDVKLASLN